MAEPASALLDAAALLYDGGDMGVTVRDKHGNGTFWVFIHKGNDRAQKSVGSKPAAEAVKVEVERALALADICDRDVSLEALLSRVVERAAPAKTVAEYAPEWLKNGVHVYGWKRRTLHEYRKAFHNRIEPDFGDIPLPDVDARTIKAWVSDLFGDELAGNTVKFYFRILSSLLSSAVEDELIPANPCLGRKRWFKLDKPDPSMWTDDELDTVLKAARFAGEPLRTLVPLLDQTGLRISEACGLEWRDVDLANGVVMVARQRSSDGKGTESLKGRRSRMLPLPEVLRRPVGEGPVVEAPTPSGLRYIWQKFLEDLPDVEHRGFHSFRHKYATRELLDGTPAFVVSRRLGHASAAFTMDTYGHYIGVDSAPYPHPAEKGESVSTDQSTKFERAGEN